MKKYDSNHYTLASSRKGSAFPQGSGGNDIGLEEMTQESVFFSHLLSGLVPAVLFTLFFALCPVMFKAISNFGSSAASVNDAGTKGMYP